MKPRAICVLTIALFVTLINKTVAEGTAAVHLDESGTAGPTARTITMGWEFKVEERITVTALGVWDSSNDGLGQDVPVGIWDWQGRLVVSAKVRSGKQCDLKDGYGYVESTADLNPGAHYFIGAYYSKPESAWYGSSDDHFYTPEVVTWLHPCRSLGDQLQMPSRSVSGRSLPGPFGPSFLFERQRADKPMRRKYYRSLLVEDWVVTPILEEPGLSHRDDRVILVAAVARADGTSTRYLVNRREFRTDRKPLHHLRRKIAELSDQYEKQDGVAPEVALAVSSHTQYKQVLETLEACPEGTKLLPLTHAFLPKRLPVNRFMNRGDYFEDRWTGLLWQKDGEASGKRNFHDAARYAKSLRLGGQEGWRVPTMEELSTIYPGTAAFTHSGNRHKEREDVVEPNRAYWTSELDPHTKGVAFIFDWSLGRANNGLASKNYEFVRCVHDPLNHVE